MWRARWRVVVLAAVVAVALGGVAGCSGESELVELGRDPADATVPGVPPTAPSSEPNAGLSQSGEELISTIAALGEEKDLCEALSSVAFTTLVSGEFDTAALVTTPAGVTRIIATTNSTFAHLVSIAPEGVRGPLEQISSALQRVVAINPNLPDAAERARAITEDPAMTAASEEVGMWLALNCTSAVTG